ncbi:MAG: CpaF family protein [Syntrophothermus sp.]|uniref:ATPase, T2SS/T4P/T4SS family n=1 Tax=Syntrophothermus sp. TaxID=2736299 RepID=UPI00257A42F7|nr:ATPase, T2SS/T4P/T4SS family [Syntrophothermus sp.]NSW82724.1 CpaF family protein [Syntrophothermus sp.]
MLFKRSQPQENKPRTYQEIVEYVRDNYTGNHLPEEVLDKRRKILRDTQAGHPTAHLELVAELEKYLTEEGLELEGMTAHEVAVKLYEDNWGLGIIEKYYRDPEVDEIRVNGEGPGKIKIVRRGVSTTAPEYFQNPQEISQIVQRMLMHDINVCIDQSNPKAESMRKDGTRVTASCPPMTENWTFVLRKHDTFEMTVENLIKHGTLNQRLWEWLATFQRYGVNTLICGGTGTGKTHLLRRLVDERPKTWRIVSIETDRELNLSKHYPDRDIIEFEEHKQSGASMEQIFIFALRYSPDALIIGEFRGRGEATEAINACTRGCDGSIATAHFSSVELAVDGTARMILQEGQNIPLKMAKVMVATAFNIVVQMAASRDKGIKKIVRVAELIPAGEEVQIRDLVIWIPSPHDYYEGHWEFVNPPTENLLNRMRRNGLTEEEARKRGWLK